MYLFLLAPLYDAQRRVQVSPSRNFVGTKFAHTTECIDIVRLFLLVYCIHLAVTCLLKSLEEQTVPAVPRNSLE